MSTRDRLVDATRELLWERGYAATSPRDILDRAAVGQGSLYHHFSGKAELALEVLEGNRDAMVSSGDGYFSAAGTVFDRISAYLLRERDPLKGCRMGRMTEDHQVMGDDELRRPVDDTFTWYREHLTALLGEGQRSGEFVPSFTPANVAAAVVATLQGGYVLAKAADSPTPYTEAITGVLELVSTQRSAIERPAR